MLPFDTNIKGALKSKFTLQKEPYSLIEFADLWCTNSQNLNTFHSWIEDIISFSKDFNTPATIPGHRIGSRRILMFCKHSKWPFLRFRTQTYNQGCPFILLHIKASTKIQQECSFKNNFDPLWQCWEEVSRGSFQLTSSTSIIANREIKHRSMSNSLPTAWLTSNDFSPKTFFDHPMCILRYLVLVWAMADS